MKREEEEDADDRCRARDVVVMTDPADTETELGQRPLGLLDHPQLLIGYLRVIRNSRREARRGGFVPRRNARSARQRADFLFREIHFIERASDAEFARSLTSGPIIASIVRVVAVDDDCVAFRGDATEMGVQLVLAVVAAIDRKSTRLNS